MLKAVLVASLLLWLGVGAQKWDPNSIYDVNLAELAAPPEAYGYSTGREVEQEGQEEDNTWQELTPRDRALMEYLLAQYEELNETPQDERPQQPAEATGKQERSTVIKKGESEFTTFVDPGQRDVSLRHLAEGPAVQVKRSAYVRVDNELRSLNEHSTMFLAIVGVGTVAAAVAMVGAAMVGYKVHQNRKAAEEAQYPQYGVIGPAKDKKAAKKAKAHGDASMAYGAQLHHYQQTKQQIIDMEAPKCERDSAAAARESDESDAEEADYSVYECPGLAPTGNIEIANPLFDGQAGGNRTAQSSTSSEPEGGAGTK